MVSGESNAFISFLQRLFLFKGYSFLLPHSLDGILSPFREGSLRGQMPYTSISAICVTYHLLTHCLYLQEYIISYRSPTGLSLTSQETRSSIKNTPT
uniref:Uncharacterized protein n=2 Tax=Lepeophtheirus salmonis TaxID=72036 RepID=A0A0K2V363_LEPSM